MCLPGPAGLYTATCVSANWFLKGNSQYPNRLLLSCEFVAQPPDGRRFWVSFKMSPEVWCVDPATKQSIRETDENRSMMGGWKADSMFKRWAQAMEPLEQLGAISDNPTYGQITQALTKYALTFRVGIVEGDRGPTNFVRHISRPK